MVLDAVVVCLVEAFTARLRIEVMPVIEKSIGVFAGMHLK